MRKVWLLLIVLTVVAAGAQTKQRFSQPASPAASYTLQLHVTHSFVSQEGVVAYLHLVGVLNGANVELVGGLTSNSPYNLPLLPLGNYPARLIADETKKDGSVVRQYDLLLANGQHESFTVVGLSE